VNCTRWKRTPDDRSALLSIPGSHSLSRESADFEFPIDATGLLVLARGSLSSGTVRIHESADVKDLKISVFAHYWNRKVLSSARVCLIERENGPNGVAILVRHQITNDIDHIIDNLRWIRGPQTPFRWIPPKKKKDRLFFVVDVTFPKSPGHTIRDVSSFTIDLPKFSLHVDDLSTYKFGAFILQSTNSPITVKVG
jgi:hypothetical protein